MAAVECSGYLERHLFMGSNVFADYSFLIVDDVRICRMNVMAILKNFGSKSIHYASNGAEAISILEDPSMKIDCIIADFKMPAMNGLQLLKAIRTGAVQNTRYDLPLVMLTGFGEDVLVGLAIKLDVSTFLLKPPNQRILLEQIQNIFTDILSKDHHLQPIDFYKKIDVNTLVTDLLKDEPSSLLRVESSGAINQGGSEKVSYMLESFPENKVLAEPLYSKKGRILFDAGTILTNRHLTQLRGLKDIGLWDAEIWVLSGQIKSEQSGSTSAANKISDKNLRSFAAQAVELHKPSFDRMGKLNIGCIINCMRCSAIFPPSQEILRKHNQRDICILLCPACSKRDDELICACVKYMLLKGGFPAQPQMVISSFFAYDSSINNESEDPFRIVRKTYRDDPLSEVDIIYWIKNNYLLFNEEDNKISCRIDKILSSPDRVQMLGKMGLQARQMASKQSRASIHRS